MFSFNPLRLSYAIILVIGIPLVGFAQEHMFRGWQTNTDKAIIALDELKQGGPPKDGISLY